MGETVEKIYCCDHGNNDNTLTAAILANRDRCNDWGPMAAMLNNQNEWMNNPFAYIMFLALFRNGFGGWDGNGVGAQGIETQAQLNAIRTQLQDNQNADCIRSAIQGNGFALSQLAQTLNIDFNTLQKCCCDVQAAIQQVACQVGFSAERVINAVNLGDCHVIEAIKDCCCSTQRQIADFRGDISLQMCQQTNTLQRGQDFINRSIERGFAATAFQAQQDKCDIIRANQDNTQRIIDTLNGHWSAEQQLQIQDLKNEISNRNQTDRILSRLGCGCNNNCGCNNGCNNCGCGF